MLTKLTLIQRVNIQDLEHDPGLKVAFAGIDRYDRPVIEVTDHNGEKLIAWTPDGPGRNPALPLRDFTEEELERLYDEDSELLFGLPWKVHLYTLSEGGQNAGQPTSPD